MGRLAEWEGCNCTVREFGLCVNLHSGDLVAQWKGVYRLYITQLRGLEGFARAAAGAFKGPKVGFLPDKNSFVHPTHTNPMATSATNDLGQLPAELVGHVQDEGLVEDGGAAVLYAAATKNDRLLLGTRDRVARAGARLRALLLGLRPAHFAGLHHGDELIRRSLPGDELLQPRSGAVADGRRSKVKRQRTRDVTINFGGF